MGVFLFNNCFITHSDAISDDLIYFSSHQKWTMFTSFSLKKHIYTGVLFLPSIVHDFRVEPLLPYIWKLTKSMVRPEH